MSIVKGFGGMKVKNNQLHFKPFLPSHWNSYAFKINFRETQLEVNVGKKGTEIKILSGPQIEVKVES